MLAGLVLVLSSRAFALVSPISENIFSPDDRKPGLSADGPMRFTGKLTLPDGAGCTAVLVARDLILTAAHCVIDRTTGTIDQGDYRFDLSLIGGKAVARSGVSWIWYGTNNPGAHRGSDWAILRLKEALGETYGWMGVSAFDLKDIFDQDVIGVTGYASRYKKGKTASVEYGCRFTAARSDGTFLHDCDTLPGVSGAPIFRVTKDQQGSIQYTLVAINVASPKDSAGEPYIGIDYSAKYANIAVPATSFVATLEAITRQ
jgi:protease YdgD